VDRFLAGQVDPLLSGQPTADLSGPGDDEIRV
jgi:hypothetical protein